jgi:hypothetical protein
MATPVVCAVSQATPKAVVRVASVLAQETNARLELVHVLEKPVLPGRSLETARAARQQLLAELLAEVPAGVEAMTRLEEGRAAETIVHACAETASSLLVVGSPRPRPFRSRSRMHRLLAFGAGCPLIVVPREAVPLGQQAVVCGVDWSPRSLKSLQLAIGLAARLDRRLVLVHAPAQPASALGRALSDSPGDGVVTIEAEPSAEVLKYVSLTYNAGFVVGGDQDRGGAGSFGRRSTASELVKGGDRPVVVLPRTAGRRRRRPATPRLTDPLADAAWGR